MRVTKEWIEMNATGRASWTKRQFQIIGVSWPPTRGWKDRVVGRIITNEAQREFEHIGAERRMLHAQKTLLASW